MEGTDHEGSLAVDDVAHFALAATITLEVLAIGLAMLRIVPAYQKFRSDGLLETQWHDPHDLVGASHAVLTSLVHIVLLLSDYWFAWLIPLVVVWGVFEWQVHSENKSLMRLSALGIAALIGAVGVTLTAASLIIPFTVAIPTIYTRPPEAIVREGETSVRASIAALEQAMASQDWQASRQHLDEVRAGMRPLGSMGGAVPAMLSLDQQPKVDELRKQLDVAWGALSEANDAILQKDTTRLEAALHKFYDAYNQVPGSGLPSKMP